MTEGAYYIGLSSHRKGPRLDGQLECGIFTLLFVFTHQIPPLGQALNTGWIMQTLWNLSPVCGNFIRLVLVQERMSKYLSCLTNIKSIYFLLVNKLCSWYLKAQPDTALYIREQTFSMRLHQRACLVLETRTLNEPVAWWPPSDSPLSWEQQFEHQMTVKRQSVICWKGPCPSLSLEHSQCPTIHNSALHSSLKKSSYSRARSLVR